jgi:hypothetical protein
MSYYNPGVATSSAFLAPYPIHTDALVAPTANSELFKLIYQELFNHIHKDLGLSVKMFTASKSRLLVNPQARSVIDSWIYDMEQLISIDTEASKLTTIIKGAIEMERSIAENAVYNTPIGIKAVLPANVPAVAEGGKAQLRGGTGFLVFRAIRRAVNRFDEALADIDIQYPNIDALLGKIDILVKS